MKYIISLGGKDYEIAVTEKNAEIVSVRDSMTPAPAAPAAKPVAAPASAPAAVPAAKPVAAPAPAPAAASAGGAAVNSPMPGNILKLAVKVGDSVKEGQLLLILEAMKMENEIFAPSAGTIASIAVSVGASVDSGALLMTIA